VGGAVVTQFVSRSAGDTSSEEGSRFKRLRSPRIANLLLRRAVINRSIDYKMPPDFRVIGRASLAFRLASPSTFTDAMRLVHRRGSWNDTYYRIADIAIL